MCTPSCDAKVLYPGPSGQTFKFFEDEDAYAFQAHIGTNACPDSACRWTKESSIEATIHSASDGSTTLDEWLSNNDFISLDHIEATDAYLLIINKESA